MNRLNTLASRAAQFLSWCFQPVMLLLTAFGTNCFRVRALFMSRDHARATALRLDFTAASLGLDQPLRSRALYQRAVIAAKRCQDPALLQQTLTFAADHYFACRHWRKARRAARLALVLAAARCGEPLKTESRYYENQTMQSLTALIRQCHWLIRGKEARSQEQSGETCLSEGKYMHAATMFRLAAETATIAVGPDALPVGLLYARQGDALLEYHQYAKAVRVLNAANNIVCEWLERSDPLHRKITDNFALAVRSLATKLEDSEPQTNQGTDENQSGYGGVWPYGF